MNNIIELDAIHDLMKKLHVNKDEKNKIFSILFICKFYDTIKDIALLLHNDSLNSIPILLRVAIVILYDLKNIEINPHYLEFLVYSSAKNEIKRINQIEKIKVIDDELKKAREDYSLLIDNMDIPKKAKKGEIPEIFKFNNVIGDDLFYRIVYSYLSKEIHSNILLLEKQYLKITGNKITFTYNSNHSFFSKEELITIVNITIYEVLFVIGKIFALDVSRYENTLSHYYTKA
jgi:hypothetical protein